MRVAWGKGNGGVGLGARGSCQGVLGGRGPPFAQGERGWAPQGDATGVGGRGCPAWPLWIPAFDRNDAAWGSAGRRGLLVAEGPLRGPQDRLRQAQGQRARPALGSRFRGTDDGGVRAGECGRLFWHSIYSWLGTV